MKYSPDKVHPPEIMIWGVSAEIITRGQGRPGNENPGGRGASEIKIRGEGRPKSSLTHPLIF